LGAVSDRSERKDGDGEDKRDSDSVRGSSNLCAATTVERESEDERLTDALGVVSIVCDVSMCATWSRECNDGAAEGGGPVAILAVAAVVAVEVAGDGDDEEDESASELLVSCFKGPWLAENEAIDGRCSVDLCFGGGQKEASRLSGIGCSGGGGGFHGRAIGGCSNYWAIS